MMVGRLLSFWDGIFSGAMLNFRWVSNFRWVYIRSNCQRFISNSIQNICIHRIGSRTSPPKHTVIDSMGWNHIKSIHPLWSQHICDIYGLKSILVGFKCVVDDNNDSGMEVYWFCKCSSMMNETMVDLGWLNHRSGFRLHIINTYHANWKFASYIIYHILSIYHISS